ncbi:MAG: rod shape-determining protein MreC, partial [Planctomycetota bacterium]
MRYRQKRRFTKRTLLGLLLAGSIVGLLLPASITGRLMNLVQVLVPLQAGVTRLADGTTEALDGENDGVPAAEHGRLARQAEALQNQVASMSVRIAQLEQANRELTGIRDGGRGPEGVLIPARVVADDLLAWRESGLIDAGTLRGVRRGAAVTSRSPTLDVGSRDGVTDGMAILAAEVLVGWVEHVGTHTTRVKLLSDPASRMTVTIGRLEQGRYVPASAAFWLEGAGSGLMKIIEVDHRYVEGDSPELRIGDRVTTLADDPELPASMTIGTVTEIRPNPDNALLYTATVESTAPERLRRVYVLDTTRHPG